MVDRNGGGILKIFLTGPKGVGKTTIVLKVMMSFDKVAGFFTKKLRNGVLFIPIGEKEKFFIGIMTKNGMTPYMRGFEKAVEFLKNLRFDEETLLVMDELGFLERRLEPFLESVERSVLKAKRVLGVVREDSLSFFPFLKREDLMVMKVSCENREHLPEKVLKMLRGSI